MIDTPVNAVGNFVPIGLGRREVLDVALIPAMQLSPGVTNGRYGRI